MRGAGTHSRSIFIHIYLLSRRNSFFCRMLVAAAAIPLLNFQNTRTFDIFSFLSDRFFARSRPSTTHTGTISSSSSRSLRMCYYIIRIRIRGLPLRNVSLSSSRWYVWDMTFANMCPCACVLTRCRCTMRDANQTKITCIYFFLSFCCHLLWHSARFSRKRWETSSRGAKDEPIMCLNAYVEWHYWWHFIRSPIFSSSSH